MYLGSYEPSFDKKSRRIALPKKIRGYLTKNEIVLSYGYEECIFGFDRKTFEKESQKQIDKPLYTREARDIRRFFFASAELIGLDDQGRLVIPANLLLYAKVAKPIIIGAGDHIEIWEKNKWEEHKIKLRRTLV